ncbi:uncharacterized protein DUF4393 [Flavobacterium sp. 9]|uniref:Abi-alpha family protein n=1 Tax=Flavobacterium sp. 9 TaxID=2035198 RepID=UPI000C18C4F8|nr:Abi-alpha family protein [Flavobacterium sp. 9]PIF34353.1 uncharacterized protein DUF4393 [Flavobacterium sp. 9]
MEIKDVLGIEPIGKAIETTVTKSFEAIEGFLKLVCAPALEEVGLLAKDQVRSWRFKNVLNIIEKAQGKIDFSENQLQIKADPKIAISIIENGSLNDDPDMQDLWAGLFASSCTKEGQEDENLIFIDLLKQITKVQAKILKYACENSKKVIYQNGLILGFDFEIEFPELTKLTGVTDVHRLDRELDHLRSLQLISNEGGFDVDDDSLNASITPSALGLNLYLKSQGYNGDPSVYWRPNLVNAKEFKQV